MALSRRMNVRVFLNDVTRLSPLGDAIGMSPTKAIFKDLQTPISGAIAIIDTALQDAGELELRK